jgi:sterol desaturase/sphingolipid hydroxylase (fatty acid hydroxylase superfamily)
MTAASRLGGHLAALFLSPGSTFSAASLAVALLIAVGWLAAPRLRRGRPVRVRALARALFPRRVTHSASSRADFGFFLLNTFPMAAIAGWVLLSAGQVGHAVAFALASLFGRLTPLGLDVKTERVVATLALFLAYEFGYWLNHYLSHKLPWLWEFHKVHHTAEVLTPLTVFRVHPVDSLVFANMLAVVMGATAGLLQYLLGPAASPFALSGTNLILLVFLFLTIHLQHSQLWISFPGLAGRLFLSPAHHQVHHSANPLHFNRNFGSCLAIWDWAFGTLHAPSARRERLTFGAELHPGAAPPHSVTGTLLDPFGRAARPWLARARRLAVALSLATAPRPAGRPGESDRA